jgi:hypothetical protein
LKPVEMFIPPAYHAWDALAFFGHRYLRWSGWRGEAFLPYLGLVGIAGFAWLVVATVKRIVARRPLPGQALSIGWIVAYASIGGVTNLLALYADFQVFRAANRGAIFISALVLCFLAVRLSRATGAWPGWARMGGALLIGGFGVLEQLPRREPAADRAARIADVEGDRQFGRQLESALPAGAMVFQLPVLGFPEVATPYQLGDYEHFRPYLATETLRFSYGAAKARARGRWQHELADRPMAEVVPRLERHGFAALYINRKGYADRAEGLLRELAALGYASRIEATGWHQVVVPLRPAARPSLPLSESLTLGQGWHLRPVAGVHWAYGTAALSYFNPHPHPVVVDVSLTLAGVTPRAVEFAPRGGAGTTFAVTAEPRTVVMPSLTLAPGVNRFVLRSPQKPQRDPAAQNQLRSFGLVRSIVTPAAAEPGLDGTDSRSAGPVVAAGG